MSVHLSPAGTLSEAQQGPQAQSAYCESDAHGGREGALDELALVELNQQGGLPHAAVPHQDGLKGLAANSQQNLIDLPLSLMAHLDDWRPLLFFPSGQNAEQKADSFRGKVRVCTAS